MGLKDVLATQGPRLALMAMAAKQGGPQALSAFMEGVQQKELQAQQLGRQRDADARAAELQRAQLGNLDADNRRLDNEQQARRLQQALALIEQETQRQSQTATDPAQAENAIMQRAVSAAGLYGMQPDQLTGMVPSMAAPMAAGQKKRAKAVYADFLDQYKERAAELEHLTMASGEFAGQTFAQIREAAEAVPPPPAPKKPLQIVDRGGLKEVVDPSTLTPGQTFTDVPSAAQPDAQEPLVAIMGPDGVPVLVPRSQAVGKRPASTREQGRPVMSSDANRIIDLDTSLNDLAILEKEITVPGGTGAAAKVGAMLPNVVTEFTGWGSAPKQRQAVIDRVKQVIGKALEGGVLRKEDEYKYVKILPTILDPPEVAAKKIAGLRQAIQQRRVTTLEGLSDAGFDTSKFAEPSQSAPAGGAQDPLGLFK